MLGACAAWPLVIRATSEPRRLLFRLAVIVTLVLWLPDLWLLVRGEPAPAVGVLMVMHLAVAVITYHALVRLAPPRPAEGVSRTEEPAGPPTAGGAEPLTPPVWAWVGMLVAVGVEFALGVAALVTVPSGRPDGWIPVEGRALYLAHALAGGLLGVGALVVLGAVRHADRISRLAGGGGVAGIALGAVGGMLSVDHPTRAIGMVLMLAGTLLSGFAYLVPVVEALPDPVPPSGPPPSR